MTTTALSPSERKGLKARAHFLDPVVLIGESGYTPAVLREIELNLTAHELIKVRVAGDDRVSRATLLEVICAATGAQPVQHIGKLLVLYRPEPKALKPPAKRIAKKTTGRTAPAGTKRNPISGRTMAPRPGQVVPSTRKAPKGARPPRTARVRKSGQRSTKKAFQVS